MDRPAIAHYPAGSRLPWRVIDDYEVVWMLHDRAQLILKHLLTDGRLDLGLGSGWNKPEYELLDLSYDRPALRAARLRDAVAAMKSAWAGETLAAGDPGADRTRAVREPVQRPHPPLLIGGHGDTILGLAADGADVMGLAGLTWTGASLAPTGASTDALAERVTFVRDRAGARFGDLELNILTQVTSIGGDAEATLAGLASALGVEKELVRYSPLTLIGSVSEVVDKLVANRERLGISYVVVFDTAIDDMAPVVQRLRNHLTCNLLA